MASQFTQSRDPFQVIPTFMGARFQLECLMGQGAHCLSPSYPQFLSLGLSWEQILLSRVWECPHLHLGKEGRLPI